MKKALGISLACVVALTAASYGKPADMSTLPRTMTLDAGGHTPAAVGASLSSGGYVYFDTVTYGGTVWAADSNRWEALRGAGATTKCWTFNTGIGSNYTEVVGGTFNPKPAGYIHRAEGWYDIDNTYSELPYFRRTGPLVPNGPGTVTSTCVISGTASMWAGVNLDEANAQCYAAGQGYGDSWNIVLGKSFTYTSGNVAFGYKYAVESENTWDFLVVSIDTTGNGSQDDVEIAAYTGVAAGTAAHVLTPGVDMRSTPGPVKIKYAATSDGNTSDQTGGNGGPTTCGLGIVDDITMTGGITENATFEAGNNGWTLQNPSPGVGGRWMNIKHLNQLPAPATFCPCAMADSVMLFADDLGIHSTNVDNMALSPWCDLRASGDNGKPGKLIITHGYYQLGRPNGGIYILLGATWYPTVCASTGKIVTKPVTGDGFVYSIGSVANCTRLGNPTIFDFSAVIESGAEQVRIGLGVYNFCRFIAGCINTGGNASPWFDQIALGVFGSAGAPIISMRSLDVFQDNFASDGTLLPSSTARMDVNNVIGQTVPVPNSVLGDTLVINGDGGNQEVKVVFRIKTGPGCNLGNLTAWKDATGLHGWVNTGIAAPGYFGNTWWEARCDTAEASGTIVNAKFMSTMWDGAGSGFVGSDTDKGGEGDAGQLSHDIFPDKILTPGSRIDYFLKARYLPPDPRNPGGTAQYLFPDTTNRNYLEMEVMPSSMAADTSWNCVLYVDHRSDRDGLGQSIMEAGLVNTLGAGGNNPEQTRYDRYDVQAPSSQQASFGRPLGSQYGAGIIQTFAYKAIEWASGTIPSFNLVDEDASQLAAWLTITEVGGNRFWGSGDNLAFGMAGEGEPTTVNFLNNVLGVRYQCDIVRNSACSPSTTLDSTFCLPTSAIGNPYFATATPTNVRGNGCPNIRSFDVLFPNTSVATAVRQLNYVKNGSALASPYALSVANYNTIDVDYKTVLDGADASALRDPNGSVNASARCNITTPAINRADEVFDWFKLPTTFSICKIPAAISGPRDDFGSQVPKFRSSLGNAYPNPMNPTTRIKFTNGINGGKVNISIFDVTGRLVKSLVDAPMTSGVHEVTWDGSDNLGGHVTSGMYFIKMATKDTVQSKKLVVSK